MQARFIHDGKAVDFFPETDIPAGTVIVEGDLVGVTKVDIPAGRLGALHVVGVYDIAKNDTAISLGSNVYWDNTAKQAVTTATGFPVPRQNIPFRLTLASCSELGHFRRKTPWKNSANSLTKSRSFFPKQT